MKRKTSIILILVAIIVMALSACRTTKPPCPAYSSTQTTAQTYIEVAR